MKGPARLAAVATAGGLLLASCGGGGQGAHSGSQSLMPCVQPSSGVGPGASGTLQNADNGRAVCFRVGQELTVFLRVPPSMNSARWQPIDSSDTAVLAATSSGVLSLPIGVTAGVFRALRPGVSTLTSYRPPCTSYAGCPTSDRWSATVVVRWQRNGGGPKAAAVEPRGSLLAGQDTVGAVVAPFLL